MVELEWCVVPVRAPWGMSWGVRKGSELTLAYANRGAAEAAAIAKAKAARAGGEPAAAAAFIAGQLHRLWPPLTGRRGTT